MGIGNSKLVTDPATLAQQEFDYIVIGAGAAGCVLANRLSENPKVRVLLVEAGGNNEKELLSKVPAAWPQLMHTPNDWAYKTTPQKELNGRELEWARGKLLGGSTSINAMMFQTAPPEDIDEWERKGATGWNWNTLQPYFRKSEKFTPSALRENNTHEYRGDSGLWLTGYQNCSPITDDFVAASANVGIPRVNSSATAYLPTDVRARSNLVILTNTLCTKLVLTGSGDAVTCTGAEFATSPSSPKTIIKAQKEVIVATGAVNTPQLLMISGIGPAAELARAGIIPQVVSEHVGQHLTDHLISCAIFHAKESVDYLASPIKGLPALAQWLFTGKGPMTTNAGEGATFLRLDQTQNLWETKHNTLAPVMDTTSGPGAPDIELICAPVTFFKHGQGKAGPGEKNFTIGAGLLRPASEGYIGLKSANPFEYPIIEANYFSNRSDIDSLIRAIRITLKITQAAPLADKLITAVKQNDDMSNMHWLHDQDPETLTDAKLEQWLRGNVETLYHPVATARMASSISDGVVNSELRVFGVSNLRICDASVFPTQVAGHTTATVIAVGERLSDMIIKGSKA
ncbi:alcohol oxidase [Clavulina sp. PMI_390]|nr:alcohol oxidase [Clavulina sp. PMI_390]